MKDENGNLGELRKIWVEMGEKLGMQSIPDNDPGKLDRQQTALDKIRRKYRVFWIVALLMIFNVFLIFSGGIFGDNPLNFYFAVAYALYFLTAFIMDHWLWVGLGTIDPLRMGVAQVAEKSMFYRKRHLQFMAILIPMAIVLLGFTGYVYSTNIYFLNGIICGAIFGAVIGIIQFRWMMQRYRELSE